MRHPGPGLVLGVLGLAVVLLLVWTDSEERISPGPLHPAHHSLEGSASCERCHADEGKDLSSTCGACHESVVENMLTGSALHGSFERQQAQQCGFCHPEHVGLDPATSVQLAFARIGVNDVQEFDHGHLTHFLHGAHDELACETCHPAAHAEALAEGETRFTGLGQTCVGCHDDAHDGSLGADCESCHGQTQPFATAPGFEHPRGFPLAGAHKGLRCESCHADGSGLRIDAVQGHSTTVRACGACHDAPHSSPWLEALASFEALDVDRTCALCHTAEPQGFSAELSSMSKAHHGLAGMNLEAPHDEQACGECHASTGVYGERFPSRVSNDCLACHADPHAGQFASEPQRTCLDCHERTHWLPAKFGLEEHASTPFPLHGRHATLTCTECHRDMPQHAPESVAAQDSTSTRPRPQALDAVLASMLMRGTPSACDACHTDPHRAQFGAIAPEGASCETCHGSDQFHGVSWTSTDHGRWTNVPLEFSHAGVACEACHPRLERALPDGRGFALAQEHFGGDPTRCATCHEDVHGKRFGGADDCSICHRPTSFLDTTGFDHGHWTGMALVGAHERAQCTSCHGAGKDGRQHLGRVREHFGPGDLACSHCHDHPHGDDFSLALAAQDQGVLDCAACHDQEAWQGSHARSFDHAHWTGFSIRGAHGDLACEACHNKSAPGRELGHSSGRRCEACHIDPHVGQFASRGRTDCARCHDGEASFTKTHFDHAMHSRFALDKLHSGLACSACHKATPVASGGVAIRYKPLGTACADCHKGGDR